MQPPRKKAEPGEPRKAEKPRPPQSKTPIERQVSAGGVAFRKHAAGIEVALVAVGPAARWQLPKGMVEPGEQPEAAALRETAEEAGIRGDLVAPLGPVEYWYVGDRDGQRIRFHKFVHFYLLRYRAGDVSEHGREVVDARWVGIDQAVRMLAFATERAILERARDLIAALP